MLYIPGYLPHESGTLEYALLLLLVGIVCIIIIALLVPAIGAIFSKLINNL